MNVKNILLTIMVLSITISIGCSENKSMSNIISKTNSTEITNNNSEFGLQEIKHLIINTDMLYRELDLKITSKVIGKHDNIDVLETVGEYNTIDQVMNLLGNYSTQPMVEKELKRKRGLVNINGKIGRITASGEVYFRIEDRSEFKIIVNEENKKVVEVKMFSESEGFEKNVQYIIEKFDSSNWKITDMNYPQNSFRGEWKVNRIIAYAGIYTEEEGKDLIGRRIIYSAGMVKSGEITCYNPEYNISVIKKEDFESGERVSFADLGINDDSITRIIVKEDKHNWEYTGGYFYFRDNNTLIIPAGGKFYEVVRIQ